MNLSKYTITKPECQWDGLTLDEIRYARALTQTRILISREILGQRAKSTFNGNDMSTNGRTLLGRMLGALSWIDYGLIGLRIGSKVLGMFHRKRR